MVSQNRGRDDKLQTTNKQTTTSS
uniref:Uncharacterized protein n=1 Tax=Anguilla anguilla TaxID=7936 RepID=A0A0E9SK54_ANGAN